jgi:hypothetical protein
MQPKQILTGKGKTWEIKPLVDNSAMGFKTGKDTVGAIKTADQIDTDMGIAVPILKGMALQINTISPNRKIYDPSITKTYANQTTQAQQAQEAAAKVTPTTGATKTTTGKPKTVEATKPVTTTDKGKQNGLQVEGQKTTEEVVPVGTSNEWNTEEIKGLLTKLNGFKNSPVYSKYKAGIDTAIAALTYEPTKTKQVKSGILAATNVIARIERDVGTPTLTTSEAVTPETLVTLLEEDTNNDGSTKSVEAVPLTFPADLKTKVSKLFADVPGLQSIGTVDQYIKYLNTLLDKSAIKTILYHGTNAVFDTFLNEKRGSTTGTLKDQKVDSEYATFLSTSYANAVSYSNLGKRNDIDELKELVAAIYRILDKEASVKDTARIGELLNKFKLESVRQKLNTKVTTGEAREAKYKSAIAEIREYIENNYGDDRDLNLLSNQVSHLARLGYRIKQVEDNIQAILENVSIEDQTHTDGVFKYVDYEPVIDSGNVDVLRYDPKNGYGITLSGGKKVPVNEQSLKEFITGAKKAYKDYLVSYKTAIAKPGLVPIVMPVVAFVNNVSVVDYKGRSFVSDASREAHIQTEAAFKAGNDSVLYKRIVDPSVADSIGVFDNSNIYVLGTKADQDNFASFINSGETNGQQTTDPIIQGDESTDTPTVGSESNNGSGQTGQEQTGSSNAGNDQSSSQATSPESDKKILTELRIAEVEAKLDETTNFESHLKKFLDCMK